MSIFAPLTIISFGIGIIWILYNSIKKFLGYGNLNAASVIIFFIILPFLFWVAQVVEKFDITKETIVSYHQPQIVLKQNDTVKIIFGEDMYIQTDTKFWNADSIFITETAHINKFGNIQFYTFEPTIDKKELK